MSEYNLIDEPWLPVIDMEMQSKRVSLREAMMHARDYKVVDGETELQTVALLRMLLALSITILYRYDENGNESDLTEKIALKRWENIYRAGAFPSRALEHYFYKWHDRFWLFDDKYPFYQVALGRDAKKLGDDIRARRIVGDPDVRDELKKLEDYNENFSYSKIKSRNFNGAILESENKPNASASRNEESKDRLTLPEAIGWLIFQMAYADCGSVGKKPFKVKSAGPAEKVILPLVCKELKGKRIGTASLPPSTEGCLIYAHGENLFEILMLNACLVKDPMGNLELYDQPHPAWERDGELLVKCPVSISKNIPELFTLQTRRFILHREEANPQYIDMVYGAMGDYFGGEAKSIAHDWEPMFIREYSKNKIRPKHFRANTVYWQNCKYLVASVDKKQVESPTVARWATWALKRIVHHHLATFHMTDVEYGTGNSNVAVMYSGFTRVGIEACHNPDLAYAIRIEIEAINKYAEQLRVYGGNLAKAAGANDNEAKSNGKRLEKEYLDLISVDFQRYLDGQGDEAREKLIQMECEHARGVMKAAFDQMPLEAAMGHSKMTMGEAYKICHFELCKLRKEGEKRIDSIDEED